MEKYKSSIKGHLDIFVINNENEFDDEIIKWQEVLIHGDPEGLKSFGQLLIKMAELNQDDLTYLPVGAREHTHLRPDLDLSKSSAEVVVGRLDAKGAGEFYERYQPKAQ